MAIKFLNGIDVEGSMNLHSDDIPNLNASKVTSGTFSTSRIPNLSASKITSGTINAARLPDLSGTYQPKGNYLTSIPAEYLTQTEGDARYLTSLPSHNHDTLYDSIGSADAVNQRIDSEVFPAIQTPAITSNGSTPSLNSGISAGEVRGLIGAQPSGTYNTIIGTDSDINTSGSTIIDNIYVTDGVITSMGTRTLTLGDLGFTGAANANYITNNNQLTNGAGYLTTTGKAADSNLLDGINSTSFLRSDANDTMSGRLDNNVGIVSRSIDIATTGNRTIQGLASDNVTGSYGDLHLQHYGGDLYALSGGGNFHLSGNLLLTGESATTSNQARTIDFTGFDKEGTTDYSDRAYIQHTTATGGHSGSVLVISSQNDSGDGIAFLTHASSKLKHNGNNIATESYVNTAVANIVDTAPAALNTLNELAAALGDDANFSTTIANNIGAVNQRIDTEVFEAIATVDGNIPTNNNQLTNGAGYITDGNTNWNNTYGFITEASYIKAGGSGPSTENLNTIANSVVPGQLEYRGFNLASSNRPPASDNANGVITVGQHSGNYNAQLAFSSDGNMYFRDNPSSSFGSWRTVWDSENLDAFVGATVSNDTITFTKANGGTVAVTTSDANTNTWRPIDDTPVNGVTDQSISSNWAYDHVNASNPHGTTASDVGADPAGSAASVDTRITEDIAPAIGAAQATADNAAAAAAAAQGDADKALQGVANIPTNNNQLTNGAGYITSQRAISSTPTNGATTTAISSDWAFDNVKTPVPTNAKFTDTNTQLTDAQVRSKFSGGTNVSISAAGVISATDTNTQLTDAQVRSKFSAGTNVAISATGVISSTDTNTWRPIDSTPTNGATGDSISSDWAYDNVRNFSSGGNSLAGSFTASGDITAFSDARVKENVETIHSALEKVTSMRGVTYNKIGDEKSSMGVIAQEIQEVAPEVVRENEDGMLSVAYGNITAVLIEAIKEQQKQIEKLKSRLDGVTK